MEQKIKDLLRFINDLELLKSVLRHEYTSTGRKVSVAEHSWRMAMIAMAMEKDFPDVNISRVIEICLVHDLGEVYLGETDFPAFKTQPANKEEIEEEAIKKLIRNIHPGTREKIILLWKEYVGCFTPEAKLAKAIDKLECLIQHNESDITTWAPEEMEYNLACWRKYTDEDVFIKKIRDAVDDETKMKISEFQNPVK